MEDIKVSLKPRKKNFIDKIKGLFEDKKKRPLYLILFILPFLIAIGLFGYVTYKEVKNVLSLVSGPTEIKDENRIESMNYVLRDNATDIQKEYFAELKQAVENNASDEELAGLVCKNFVADFYTWSNKQGQYDVGGMYYVYDVEETKNNTYMQARDGFYKYLSTYIKQYGVANLLEVENVQVISSSKLPYEYKCLVNTHGYSEAEGHTYTDVEHDYDAWQVKCVWTYKENAKFDSSNYATSMNFIVVIENGRYEIVEASENEIDAKNPDFDYEDEEKDSEDTIDESVDEDEVE